MATQDTDAPPAHQGPHYSNPGTKKLLGPTLPTERGSVQRFAWIVFFVIVLGGVAIAVAIGLTGRG